MNTAAGQQLGRAEQLLRQGPALPLANGRANGSPRARSVSTIAPKGPVPGGARPRVQGKFLFVGQEKLYARGVTYGAFRPDASDREYTDLERIDRDFAAMAENGFNAVRIPHTMPPSELLDIALHHGLWVMVGLSCEQFVGYLADRDNAPDIAGILRKKVASCAGHPALLCYALGNEIPSSVARWLGAKRIERYLKRMFDAAKAQDPDGIVTYVNYPTTEYLQLDFLDFLAFNVYLEDREDFAVYLARLHHLAGARPLLMSEIGLDSLRNGVDEQARSLASQVRTTFESGCAGAFIFSWTDEWHRGGEDVHDWAFGLTDEAREPKPALRAVREACAQVPFEQGRKWPRASVVVCAYNAQATLAETLDGLTELEYPDYEVIVVDDGSTDATESIARRYDVRLISTANHGLSAARNAGLAESTGEIVAFIDADARPDLHWLQYFAAAFEDGDYAAVGGPNITPPGDGKIAECVSNAPGNPTHVMLSDRVAEHIPGCNMAFRRETLSAIGGFDPRFHVAGDDVDVCWRIQDAGGTIGFSSAAVVWHHRRNSVRAFWRQQVGYGAAEGQLEQKWPQRHNGAGYLSWTGRIYGPGRVRAPRRRALIYQGPWGTAPFQSLYERDPHSVWVLTALAEWRVLVALLTAVAAMGIAWRPLLLAAPLAAASAALMLAQAVISAKRGSFSHPRRSLHMLTAALFVLQPAARLYGRLRTHMRASSGRFMSGVLYGVKLPRRRVSAYWSETWREPAAWLQWMLEELLGSGNMVCTGREYDRWDLHVTGGRLGSARMLVAFEDNGSGNQYIRFRVWPQASKPACVTALICLTVAVLAALAGTVLIAAVYGAFAVLLSLAIAGQCARALERMWFVVPSSDRPNK
jgi:O-antigen biosynthesis protein